MTLFIIFYSVIFLQNLPFPSYANLHWQNGFDPRFDNFNRYYNNDAVSGFMDTIVARFPNQAVKKSIGKSVANRQLWTLILAHENPLENRSLLYRPDVKYVSTMHGNEPVGTVLLLRFAYEILRNYPRCVIRERVWCRKARILLETTRIHLFPLMNPDGFQVAREETCIGKLGRKNKNGVDLNRNFPDIFNPVPRHQIQPETKAVMEWMKNYHFLLSANFHTGALVVNYPYDTNKALFPSWTGFEQHHRNDVIYANTLEGRNNRKSSLTPDNETFRYISSVYANNSFRKGRPFTSCAWNGWEIRFRDGITNGAAFYYVRGGMQDYNYNNGIMAVTLEVSCCKYPNRNVLNGLWMQNRHSMVDYLLQVHQGFRGVLLDEGGRKVSNGKFRIRESNSTFSSNVEGEFLKIISPGRYTIEVQNPANNRTVSFGQRRVELYKPGEQIQQFTFRLQ